MKIAVYTQATSDENKNYQDFFKPCFLSLEIVNDNTAISTKKPIDPINATLPGIMNIRKMVMEAMIK